MGTPRGIRSDFAGKVTIGVGLEGWEDKVRGLWEMGLEPFGGHLSQKRKTHCSSFGESVWPVSCISGGYKAVLKALEPGGSCGSPHYYGSLASSFPSITQALMHTSGCVLDQVMRRTLACGGYTECVWPSETG